MLRATEPVVEGACGGSHDPAQEQVDPRSSLPPDLAGAVTAWLQALRPYRAGHRRSQAPTGDAGRLVGSSTRRDRTSPRGQEPRGLVDNPERDPQRQRRAVAQLPKRPRRRWPTATPPRPAARAPLPHADMLCVRDQSYDDGRWPFRSHPSPTASSTRVRVQRRWTAPGWQRLQYASSASVASQACCK
jgi:hypothetical protein